MERHKDAVHRMNSTPQRQKSLKAPASRTAEAPEQLPGVCPQPPEPAGCTSAWGEEPVGQAGPGASLAAASLAAAVVVVGAVLVDMAARLVQLLVGLVLLQHNTAAVAVGMPAAVAADMVVVAVAVVKVAAVLAGEVFRV